MGLLDGWLSGDSDSTGVESAEESESTPIDPNALSWGKVFDGVVDISKTVLPAALDNPGAKGGVPQYADRIAPGGGSKVAGISGPPTSFLSGNGMMIAGGIVLLVVVIIATKKG